MGDVAITVSAISNSQDLFLIHNEDWVHLVAATLVGRRPQYHQANLLVTVLPWYIPTTGGIYPLDTEPSPTNSYPLPERTKLIITYNTPSLAAYKILCHHLNILPFSPETGQVLTGNSISLGSINEIKIYIYISKRGRLTIQNFCQESPNVLTAHAHMPYCHPNPFGQLPQRHFSN